MFSAIHPRVNNALSGHCEPWATVKKPLSGVSSLNHNFDLFKAIFDTFAIVSNACKSYVSFFLVFLPFKRYDKTQK